jgi:hypothetical protein
MQAPGVRAAALGGNDTVAALILRITILMPRGDGQPDVGRLDTRRAPPGALLVIVGGVLGNAGPR